MTADPMTWAIVVMPVPGSVQSTHPGLTAEQAMEILTDIVRDYRRELGITKPLVIE